MPVVDSPKFTPLYKVWKRELENVNALESASALTPYVTFEKSQLSKDILVGIVDAVPNTETADVAKVAFVNTALADAPLNATALKKHCSADSINMIVTVSVVSNDIDDTSIFLGTLAEFVPMFTPVCCNESVVLATYAGAVESSVTNLIIDEFIPSPNILA